MNRLHTMRSNSFAYDRVSIINFWLGICSTYSVTNTSPRARLKNNCNLDIVDVLFTKTNNTSFHIHIPFPVPRFCPLSQLIGGREPKHSQRLGDRQRLGCSFAKTFEFSDDRLLEHTLHIIKHLLSAIESRTVPERRLTNRLYELAGTSPIDDRTCKFRKKFLNTGVCRLRHKPHETI